ncbi:helix-turn-helix domain-containing protein [Streptomyces sp. 3MP-14]|uniref:Helix-turn-helix domain-containing protein n=1 Tax=Streptomyces mimosae TaxID=2586635 RepID=A0A5N6AQH5_9ACTN|nr:MULTISPECIES: helix-turn-helix transcriptional regulator [Streptomyces]KAB8170931.1 helix-turn-helix domain-containing protein [Streptomyces mimosae]KAB8179718.1 helix-turn-helix domain-containing protein [Streptomyces sp. 3MP-14]
MTASPSSAAQAARERLAARLRDIRREAGLSGEELALRCGWSPSKRSRIENARTSPSDADVRNWCTACGAEDQTADLVSANRQADQMYVHWKKLHRHGMRRAQDEVLPLYARTRRFRVYCSNVVPGILQTEAYASALLSSIARFQETPDDAPEAAASRIERSRVLYEGDHRFAFVLEETVLRYRIGPPEAMASQLGYLLAVMALPNVSLGVIPADAERRMWPLEAFYLFDDRQVSTELLTAAVNVTAPSEIATYASACFGVPTDRRDRMT